MRTKVGLYHYPNRKLKWVVRWFGEYDPNSGKQKRYGKAFKLKRDAETFQAEQIAAFKNGQKRDKQEEIALDSFCNDWLKTKKIEYQPETILLYKNAITRLTAYFGKHYLISQISARMAAKFVAEQKRLDKRDGELTNWSRHRTLRNCKTMFQDAVVWGLISNNPFKHVKAPKCIIQPWHYLRPEEFTRLLNASSGKHSIRLRHKALYALAYCCGLRYGEIVNLSWQDIDFENATIKVDNKPATNMLPPFFVKDAESRTIPVPKHCLNILIDLKNYNDVTDQTPYVVFNDGQYQTVVAKYKQFKQQKRAWKNKDMQNNTLTTFKRHVKWADIKQKGALSIHTLRKSCITNWANNIKNPEVVRDLAGHSDIATTMKYYTQTDAEQKAKAAEAIDDLLKMADTQRTLDIGFDQE